VASYASNIDKYAGLRMMSRKLTGGTFGMEPSGNGTISKGHN
jgi:hypothetical protein